jgi:hypothetical protein
MGEVIRMCKKGLFWGGEANRRNAIADARTLRAMEGGLTLARAAELDAADPLHRFRSEFRIPSHDGVDCIYLCGNSLGLQPVRAAEALAVELEDWFTKTLH